MWRAGGTRKISTARSRSMNCSNDTTRRTKIFSSSARGTTAAGPAKGENSAASILAAQPGNITAQNIMSKFLPITERKGRPGLSEAPTFRTGANEWVNHDAWPPKRNVVGRKLYFHEKESCRSNAAANGQPCFDSLRFGSGQSGSLSSASDPAVGMGNVAGRGPAFVDHRPDVLTWVTDPLTEDIVVSGKIVANLFASTRARTVTG